MSLSGRTAVVTGGASGMGVAICERLGRDGAAVAVLDINYGAAERLVEQLRADGSSAIAVEVDVADRGQVDRAVGVTHEALGPIHVLVHSAGIAEFVPFQSITEEVWDHMIAVNLKGTFNCTQAVIGDMVDAGWGRIVLISSSGAQSGAARQAHYIASKGGVIGLTKSLALEFGPAGITVNTVPPGSINTPLLRWATEAGHVGAGVTPDQLGANLPVGRIGRPEDIAAACAFLASEEAGYVTGQILGVNGGRYM